MIDAKHTPGPWEAQRQNDGWWVKGPHACVCDVTDQHAKVADGVIDFDAEATAANAALIAAAPALLAELAETCDWLDKRAGVMEQIAQQGRPACRPALHTEAVKLRGRAALIRLILSSAAPGA